MKFFKFGLVSVISVAVTCILIFTFTQEPFKATAPVLIFWYKTPGAFPLYLFAAATFAIGLLIGFAAAAYYYIAGQAGIHSKKKEIKRLEGVIIETTAELEQLRNAAGQAQKKATDSMKAVGE